MNIWCCGCNAQVSARLTSGAELYQHRLDLRNLPFWICDACRNFVGCHHKTKNRTRPLGCIPTKELKEARKHIHALIDPLWQSGLVTRKALYAELGGVVGRKYHTAELRSIDEARDVYRAAKKLSERLGLEGEK